MRPNFAAPSGGSLLAAQRREEKRLLKRVLAGEAQAWTELCQRYQNLILACVIRTLRRYGAPFSNEDLADLVSEVWVTLLRDNMRKLRLYDPRKGYRLASWIGLLATNAVIDQLRLRSGECSYLDDLTCAETLLVETEGPDSGIEAAESADLARQALGHLTAEEREFVFHCYHEERRPEDLALRLGISVNTVYSRKFKIREKLSRIVADLGQRATPAAAAA
jgi:RNA polymerase sigma-70 factor (ECF subfamily)